MKIGIIIIFYNNEKQIDTSFFIEQVKQASNLELCLVNNDSCDNTYHLLTEIKEACNNVSVVNIRKFKSDTSAVKAGARFMFNQFNLKHLGYVYKNVKNIKYGGLIKLIAENEELILKYNLRTIDNNEVRQTLFQSLFSVLDYLKKIKTNKEFIQFQY